MIESASTILVIDDDRQIRRMLRTAFELEGFAVRDAANASEGIQAATDKPPDLVILDLRLPDMDGGNVLQQLRSWTRLPVIVLSVRSGEEEKVRLLELGADDYVVKPFGMAELVARARMALRRHVLASADDTVIKCGPLEIDLAARSVAFDGQPLALTPKEFKLLYVLARHSGKVVTHQHLLNEIWGPDHSHDGHYLRMFIRKLRRKIELDPAHPSILLTVLGVGYRMARPGMEKEAG
jgi:two-component system, OmpR family, KDP operon response regulator KdpE